MGNKRNKRAITTFDVTDKDNFIFTYYKTVPCILIITNIYKNIINLISRKITKKTI